MRHFQPLSPSFLMLPLNLSVPWNWEERLHPFLVLLFIYTLQNASYFLRPNLKHFSPRQHFSVKSKGMIALLWNLTMLLNPFSCHSHTSDLFSISQVYDPCVCLTSTGRQSSWKAGTIPNSYVCPTVFTVVTYSNILERLSYALSSFSTACRLLRPRQVLSTYTACITNLKSKLNFAAYTHSLSSYSNQGYNGQ